MPSDRRAVLRGTDSSHRGGRSVRIADSGDAAFRAARCCGLAIRKANTVRAHGLHYPGSNLPSLRALRSTPSVTARRSRVNGSK
jgi:hypothetical protein